jgi:hypothetical protein
MGMNNPHWRAEELKHLADDIAWLDAKDARRAYDLVRLYDSKTHLGLNPSTVNSLERLEFGDDVATATEWLRLRLSSTQPLVVVFGGNDCFRCSGAFFIENWQDIFVPSRDDAMIYSDEGPVILFYCHENEFELGQRIVFD